MEVKPQIQKKVLISSEEAEKHLRRVMAGTVPSKRHGLFLSRRERDDIYSRLAKLSNPCFLGQVDEMPVIERLKQVYRKYISQVTFRRAVKLHIISFAFY